MGSSVGLYRILIGESDPGEQCFLRNALSQFGHIIEMVSNGGQVLEKLSESRYAILILEAGLPGMNGIDLMYDLRNSGKQPGTIFTSDGDFPDRAEITRDFDRVGFLERPYSLDDLQEAIARVCAPVPC